ncbi:succinate dehydrogenase assembly factor 2 [Snodgrassella gandavensis]|uniref:FAD assembly factor SdhE n=1 Tax=Snodgrassella gandavensis TaxID=2946698 RepID=UPI001EF6E351|nr:succinate dehydrogenase assembly factor 2 [Snodgrassella gandavensis]
MQHFDDNAKRRIRWLTRRGLLELDIILGRFMSQAFDQLSDDDLSAFVALMDLPDPEILALINQSGNCESAQFEPVLEKIRQAQFL